MAFIIFTEAINQFPGAQFWAVLFFLMLFTLGIDSQFGMLEGLATSLVDMKLFPKLPKDMIIGVRFLKIEIYHNNTNLSDLAFLDSLHIMRYHINCIRSWSWQLCISADGQFCWKLLSLDHCVL